MIPGNGETTRFFGVWTEEFTRAVEMFSAIRPLVQWSTVERLEQTSDKLEKYLWWKQSFEGTGAFLTWIGTEESTWSALGASPGESASDAKSTYLEIIGQAQQGIAAILSRGLSKPFKCRQGTTEIPPALDSLVIAKLRITIGDTELTPLIFGLGPEYMALMEADERTSTEIRELAAGEDRFAKPMLERLLELELPLSVALGRAVMPIRDVLKVTAGSLIELDRNVGDYVDLVVHGKVVARGEVVSVKGNYGVRVKEIISRDDRLTLYGQS